MTPIEVVQNLMQEIGPHLQLAEVTEFTEAAHWILIVNDDTVVYASYDSEVDQLVLSADVATPPTEHLFNLYERLLQFNDQWHETGGLRFSIDAPEGMVCQILSLPMSATDLHKLAIVFTNFIEQLRLWRDMILEGPPKEADETAESNDAASMPVSGMVRV